MPKPKSVLDNYSSPNWKPMQKMSKLQGYSQSPTPLVTDRRLVENIQNSRKLELTKIKKDLESKLKNIVTESKKHGQFKKVYEKHSIDDRNKNLQNISSLRVQLDSLDQYQIDADKQRQLRNRKQPSSLVELKLRSISDSPENSRNSLGYNS